MSEENKETVNKEEKRKTSVIINKGKEKLSPVRIVEYVLVILCVLLLIGIWFRINPMTPKPSADTDPDGKPEQTAEPTPLPYELIDPSSVTVLVNKSHSLPSDYVPSDLVTPYVLSTSDVIQVSSLAADPLKAMVNAAGENGITLYLTAGYISYETQDDYFDDRAGMIGEAEANKTIAKAGFSEHQTGLALDFSDSAEGYGANVAFAETDAGKWLAEHAWEYGFILRYPEGKESITGYSFQPWHYRYIGEEISRAMHETAPDLTMEEYYSVN